MTVYTHTWTYVPICTRLFNLRLLPHLLWNFGYFTFLNLFTWFEFTVFVIFLSTSSEWTGCNCVLPRTYWSITDTYILHLSIVQVDLYSEGAWSTGRQHQTYWQVFRGVTKSLQAHTGIEPRLGHCCFLPYPFQFINHPTTDAIHVVSTASFK